MNKKNSNIRFSDLNFHGLISSKDAPPAKRTRLMNWLEEELNRIRNLQDLTEAQFVAINFLLPFPCKIGDTYKEFQVKLALQYQHVAKLLQLEIEFANG